MTSKSRGCWKTKHLELDTDEDQEDLQKVKHIDQMRTYVWQTPEVVSLITQQRSTALTEQIELVKPEIRDPMTFRIL